MDCFDFEGAALAPFDMDDFAQVASLDDSYGSFEIDQDSLRPFTTDTSSPSTWDHVQVRQWDVIVLKMANDCEVEAIRWNDESEDYPMFKAKHPCELCSRMGMDCYLATRGMLVTGCTPCISLYRECSHTHPHQVKGFVATFPGIAEDEQVNHGPLTSQMKPLASHADARGRKTGSRFPRDAVRLLKQWLSEHSDHPYPTERERDELKRLTGLKRSQINNWLANARRRGKLASRSASTTASPMLGAIDIPNAEESYESMGPLDRWKCSPPEHEPATMTDIAKAITEIPRFVQRNSSSTSLQNSRASSRKGSSDDDSGISMFRAPSTSSFDTRDSSNSDFSFASSRSQKSRGSLHSFASSQERRRRRRQPLTARTNLPKAEQALTNDQNSKAKRIFQCTFCTDTFAAKYDWQRHEKSLHLALERWTCCPLGATRIDPVTGLPQCVFCQQLSPNDAHMETHNYDACQEKSELERTFYRKDHLRQHLKLMHGVKYDPHMETWRSTTFEIRSRCGFCPSQFVSWQQRADHLAAHFRNGCDMMQWSGSHGFEAHVEKLVENSIPPYLIGHERQTMNPYIVRPKDRPSPKTQSTNTDIDCVDRIEANQLDRDSNCWSRLEGELINFVVEQKALGIIPTDKMLQDYARLQVYGTVDEWDWTAADNQVWLKAFRCEQGISNSESQEYTETRDVPIHAPYVVKGGVKSMKTTCANHMSSTPAHRRSASNLPMAPPRRTHSGTSSAPLASTPCTPNQNYDFNFDVPATYDAPEVNFDIDAMDLGNLNLGTYAGLGSFDPSTATLPMSSGMDYTLLDLATDTSTGTNNKQSGHVLPQALDEHAMTLAEFDRLTGYVQRFT